MAPSEKKQTPRPAQRQVKRKQAKLKEPEDHQRYLPSYELELGRRPVQALSGDVMEAHCKFCLAFGREEKAMAPVTNC